MPVLGTDVATVLSRGGTTSADTDDGDEDKNDDDEDLEGRLSRSAIGTASVDTYSPELLLCVPEGPEKNTNDDDSPEDSNPCGQRNWVVPEHDGRRRHRQL